MSDSPWAARAARAASIRVLAGSFLASLIVATVLSLIWHPLLYSFFVIWPLAWLGNVADDTKAVVCPHCGKRVKYGYSTCHHCGAVAVQQ